MGLYLLSIGYMKGPLSPGTSGSMWLLDRLDFTRQNVTLLVGLVWLSNFVILVSKCF